MLDKPAMLRFSREVIADDVFCFCVIVVGWRIFIRQNIYTEGV